MSCSPVLVVALALAVATFIKDPDQRTNKFLAADVNSIGYLMTMGVRQKQEVDGGLYNEILQKYKFMYGKIRKFDITIILEQHKT